MGDNLQKKEIVSSTSNSGSAEPSKPGIAQGGKSTPQSQKAQHEGSQGYQNFTGNQASNKQYKYYNKQNYNNPGNGNNNAQNSGNRQHYNRKSYNQKMNPNQFNSYTGYPANMYAYGYYPSPYGYATPMVPGMAPMQPYPQQTGYGVLPGNKIKITDREGKQIDLEEKKKYSNASNTPISSPNAGNSPLPASHATISNKLEDSSKSPQAEELKTESHVASNSGSPQVPKEEITSSSKLAVEEFRRKILEKLAKAANEKKKEEIDEELKETEKTTPSPKEHDSELTASNDNVALKSEVVPESPVQAGEELVETEAEKDEADSKNEIASTNNDNNTSKSLDVEEARTINDEEITSELEEEPIKEVEDPEKTLEKEISLTASEIPEAAEEDLLDSEEGEVKVAEEETKEEEQTLSQFFDKLKTVGSIEDPFDYEYPKGFTAVDPKWKMSSKKYRYDPQFLIQFREVLQFDVDSEWKSKLESLGIVPVVRKGPSSQQSRGAGGNFPNSSSNRFNGPLGRGQFNDGRANSRNGSRRRGGSGGPREKSTRRGNQSRRSGRDNKDQGEDSSKPAEEVKPLEKSANRWVPRSRLNKTEAKLAPDGSEIFGSDEIERKVKSLLNKLTLEMFEQITDDLLNLAQQSKWEDDAKTVRQIIHLTFAKACDEPYWSSMYAQFCAKMCTKISDDIKDVNIRLKTGDYAKGGDLARRILLTTCQAEYEKGWTDKLPTNPDGTPLEPEMMSDEYYAMAAAKRRGLGLVKFIGHLYILNMLNDQVILLCLRDQSGNTKDPSEDSLESLAQLVNTVGARLESTEKNRAVLNFVFDNIETILNGCKLSSRIKFMLMDLIDLRAAKWKSKKENAGPKTIQEIHEEAEMKKLEEEKAAAERRRKNRNNDQRSNSSRANSSWGNQSKKSDSRAPTKDSKGFTSVQTSRSQSNRMNTSTESSNTLSPRENSKRTDSIQSNANRFAALHDSEDEENVDEHDHHDETVGTEVNE